MITVPVLTSEQIEDRLATLDGWELQGDVIQRIFKFKNFVEAIAFVNRIVEPAETANHHPDLSISYNTVTVNLTTHDACGLTEKDFELAQAIAATV
ncbi:MAG: 4a-hydroxytetrahydrobiopterin dehydratase [Cyanobacteria bacterium P01_F01_bin.153]